VGPTVVVGLDGDDDDDDEPNGNGLKEKAHFVSPKEWRMIVGFMAVLAVIRMVSMSSSKMSLFHGVASMADISSVAYNHCKTDVKLMCQDFSGDYNGTDCIFYLSPSLRLHREMSSKVGKMGERCTLDSLASHIGKRHHFDWSNNTLKPGDYPSKLLPHGNEVTTPEQLGFEKIMVFSWIQVKINSYLLLPWKFLGRTEATGGLFLCNNPLLFGVPWTYW
jgi:hypothetical protein